MTWPPGQGKCCSCAKFHSALLDRSLSALELGSGGYKAFVEEERGAGTGGDG